MDKFGFDKQVKTYSLTDVCDFQGGSQPPKDEWSLDENDGYVRMLQIRDFTQSERVTPEYIKVSNSTKMCNSDDILLARYGASVGKILTGLSGAYNVAIMKSIPDEEIITKQFLYYYFKSPYFQTNILSVGVRAAQAGFNKEDLSKLEIKCPDKDTQRKICNDLKLVEGVISKRKKQLVELDTLIKARFVELFGDLANPECKWDRERIVDICVKADDIKCGPFGTQLNKDEYQKTGVAVWEIPQINSIFTEFPTHFLTEEKAEQLNAYSLIPGDIAMSRKGNVGRCAVFPEDYEPGIIHSDVLRIRVNQKKVLPIFMMNQLHFSGAVQHQISLVSSGAIMAGINVTKLKEILVHIPPIEIQEQFADFVAQINKLKVEVQKSLDKMQILFDSLMQEYFG